MCQLPKRAEACGVTVPFLEHNQHGKETSSFVQATNTNN